MNIIVYCGASEGHNGIYKEGAIQLGQWIAEQNHTLIFGGGNAGLMRAIANSVIQHGGKTIGVMPTFLQQRELAHNGLDELIIVNSMSERKEKILSLGDVCIALPGGPGTLEEISEVVSWSRIGQNQNPCIFYNINNYYDHIQHFYNHMVTEGFLSQTDRQHMLFSDNINEMEQFIQSYQAPEIRTYK
ncbi:TIGR00730 family Rossman fold protein [Staphylococcus lugdunensis]|uniref:LOG family protein n=1 Tax=Staphylococcus lugdunensis TaxID=28035 RepID=UPI002555FF44|nr:TIGR00730 family Rossman fold protein [Staphylococcus lugdunensis]MDK7859800.1 TIGR00730 family Rossman fold protein [Staphylococcus lugdunensis]MDK8289259.1 TIGR00730 family Rossman fold protein [Staphylococcus lugdunensis]